MREGVALQEFKDCGHRSHFELQSMQDVPLLLQDGISGESVVANANHDRLHVEWSDVFVLRGDKHASDADQVKLGQIESLG